MHCRIFNLIPFRRSNYMQARAHPPTMSQTPEDFWRYPIRFLLSSCRRWCSTFARKGPSAGRTSSVGKLDQHSMRPSVACLRCASRVACAQLHFLGIVQPRIWRRWNWGRRRTQARLKNAKEFSTCCDNVFSARLGERVPDARRTSVLLFFCHLG